MRFRATLFALMLGLLFMLPASAQIPANKLFANSHGDIWTWFEGGNPEQITTWGYNGGPILAPDERFIAYLSLSTESFAELAPNYYPFIGTAPTNIWIMDTATQLAERIAIQDSYPTLRGIPAWSPSGREIAWLELDVSGSNFNGTSRLVVYDMDTRRTTILNEAVNLGFQDGGYHIHAVQWGSMGISRLYFTFGETGQLQFILELYAAETGALSQYLLTVLNSMSDSIVPTPIDYVWVEHQANAMIAILFSDGSWRLLNPLDGSQSTLSQAPRLMSRNGNASLSPVWQAGWEIYWLASNAASSIEIPFVSYGVSQGIPALSPDGLSVAWNDYGNLGYQLIAGSSSSLFLESSEDFSPIQPMSIVWSAMQWVTDGTIGTAVATPVLTTGDGCNLPSRLQIGDMVTVAAGEPNNVRRDARLDSPIIAQFAPDVLAQVIDGPVCVDGFRWWYVSNEAFAGWTAEGNATEYWLEPR